MPASVWQGPVQARRRVGRDRSWTVVIGPLLSIIAGLGTAIYFPSLAPPPPPGLDIVAGLLTGLVGLQLDVLWRSHRRDTERTRQGRLIEEIERVPWLPDLVGELVHDVQGVESKHGDTLVGNAMRQTIERCVGAVGEFERGRFMTDFDDNAWVFRLTQGVQRTLRASSVQDVDLAFWRSPAGRHYWNLQLEKLRADKDGKSVSIRRVFIYREWTKQLDDLAREQSYAGVHVMHVSLSRVPSRLCKDLIVWDETVGYETRVNAAGSPDQNMFTVDREDVARLVEQLELIESLAERYVFDTEETESADSAATRLRRRSPESPAATEWQRGNDQGRSGPSKR